MLESGLITLKDCFYLVLGLVLGLIVGIGIYWWPLGQFVNECKALLHLMRFRYPRGSVVIVRSGTDLIHVAMATYPNMLTRDKSMSIWHDEGVSWFHTSSGWKRARVLQVFDATAGNSPPVYRVCHLDIIMS